MKVMTVLGTRPEIIRLSLIIAKLDHSCDHILVHTGQNFDQNLNDIFFEQLGVRKPDYSLGIRSNTFGEQIGKILIESEQIFLKERPDRLLILGDTNSALVSMVAKRVAIRVFHMEAGNRCYDDRVPEEVNRRIIDHSSDVWMPYTERSRQNLLREGIPSQRIYVTGNPIYEVIRHFEPQIQKSNALEILGIQKGRYFLVTMHREENVDIEARLKNLSNSLFRLNAEYQIPVIVSTHPRTTKRMEAFGISAGKSDVRFMQPFGLFDFISLERNAMCILSDSGTVQEECAIFGIPNVTIRDVTERPETIECGSNILSGDNPEQITSCVRIVLSQQIRWFPPREYLVENVSDTVIKIVLGYIQKPD